MSNDKLDKKIAKLEEIIAKKQLSIETTKADIKELTKEIAKLREELKEQGFSDLRKVIESQGMTPSEIIELLKPVEAAK